MRISSQQLANLKVLLQELYGMKLTDEQAQEAGMAIIRFVIAKAQREEELTNMEGTI